MNHSEPINPYTIARRGLLLGGWIALVWPLAGCALPQYHPAERMNDPNLQALYQARIRGLEPGSYKLTQRVLLHVGHEDYDMTGYLFLKPDGSWLAVALGDMGMELFRFRFDGQHGEVLTMPDSFSMEPLLDGVIGDIQHLFGRRPESNTCLVQRRASAIGLVTHHDNDYLEEFRFPRGTECPGRSLGVSKGGIVREATYLDRPPRPGARCSLAHRIILNNHKWRYSLEITLLDVQRTE